MKRISAILMSGVLAFSLCACSGNGGGSDKPADTGAVFKAGTYEADGTGYGGSGSPIHVKVTVSDTAIESIEFTAAGETPTVGGAAIPLLVDKVVAAQSTKIDGVTDATFSSNGFFEAVNDCLKQAGADPEKLEPKESGSAEAKDVEETYDVVVVGAGGAGMTAAITAKENGKSVIILEKAAVPGGNSSRATGGMNAAATHYQKEQNIEDSPELYYQDTMKGGHDINDPALVKTMAEQSSAAIDWLDSIGAPLSNIGQAGGASTKRQHRPVDENGKILSVGTFLVEHLSATCKDKGIETKFNTRVDKILVEDGKAVGVHGKTDDGTNVTIHAKSVVIATGGFGSNPDLIVKYKPELKGYVSTNASTITGDAIAFLEDIGADFVDLEQIQIHPTVVQKDGSLISESLRGDGAILVNAEGKRFCNELLTRDVVSAHVNEQTGSYAWLIVDKNMYEPSTVIQKYVKNGLMTECATIADLAKLMEVDEKVLTETLNKWTECCKNQKDPDFERGNYDAILSDLSHAPYYAVKIAPGIHHTMGGVKINTNAEVIDVKGNVIPGLFAAGEVTGGVHGGNRLGGNAVCDFVVFGRIAGTSASK